MMVLFNCATLNETEMKRALYKTDHLGTFQLEPKLVIIAISDDHAGF